MAGRWRAHHVQRRSEFGARVATLLLSPGPPKAVANVSKLPKPVTENHAISPVAESRGHRRTFAVTDKTLQCAAFVVRYG